MAEFKKAFVLSMQEEGGYANNPNDRGGETYKGIARKRNPQWAGWKIIDQLKKQTGFPGTLDKSEALQACVHALYKLNYWDINQLDEINNQDIANELFDTGVNMGPATAAFFIQEALNLLNKNKKLYTDISVDGKLGFKTLTLINQFPNPKVLLKCLNGLQFDRYRNICTADPLQEIFFTGWLNRV